MPSLGHIELRRPAGTPTRSRWTACSRAGSTSSSSRPSTTCSASRPPWSPPGGPWPPRAARSRSRSRSPSSSPAACCRAPRSAPRSAAIDPLRPDVIGLNCATGPTEMGEHLRHLSQHARMPISLPAQRRPAAGHRRQDGLRADPGPAGRAPPALHHRARRPGRRRLLRHRPRAHPPGRGGLPGPDPGAPHAGARARRHLDLQPRALRAGHLVPDHRRAHQRQRLQEVPRRHARGRLGHVHADGPTSSSTRAPTSSTSASTTSAATAPSTWTSWPPASAPRSRAPLVLDSTEPQVMEAGLQHIGGRSLLNSANLEDGEAPGSRMDRVFTLCQEYGAAAICLLIDEEGQARDVEWKLRVAHRIHDIAVERYGLEPSDLVFDALTFPLSTGDEDLPQGRHRHHGGHPPDQGRAPGRAHHPRRVQRLLRPQARRPPRPQLGLPARVRRGRPGLRHRPRGADHAAQPDPRRAAPGRPRPRLRPAGHRGRRRHRPRLRPAAPPAGPVRGRRGHRGRSRRTARAGRSSNGSPSASSTASATASRPTSTRPWPTARRPC